MNTRPPVRRFPILFATVLIALLVLLLLPAASHASAGKALPIPWLDDIVAQPLASLVKVLQRVFEN